ncbi:MAG: hypothetical protein HOQ27_04820 [Dermatophilaceae bacterium]|nr:hypothetical protein [Dermatophilaceae bacterium]
MAAAVTVLWPDCVASATARARHAMRASGAAFDEDHDRVSFVPHEGAYAAGFRPASKHVRVHVDMTTEPGVATPRRQSSPTRRGGW